MVQSELRPVGLKCEYRVDPLGIGERSPRLSWALESEGRNQRQSAYRILVAGNEEDLEAEKNLLSDGICVDSLRDASFTLRGQDALSYREDAEEYIGWLVHDKPPTYP